MPSFWNRLITKAEKKCSDVETTRTSSKSSDEGLAQPTSHDSIPIANMPAPRRRLVKKQLAAKVAEDDSNQILSFKILRPRTAIPGPEVPHATPAQNIMTSRLLQLPGELRNQIYSYILYPRLDAIIIADMVIQHHYSRKALRHSIFRASHQLRNEAISFLAANKHFKICGIDSAIDFFIALGPAVADLKRISVAMTHVGHKELSDNNLARFAGFLYRMTALKYLKLEIGKADVTAWPQLRDEQVSNDFLLVEKVWRFVQTREGLKFEWAASEYISRNAAGSHAQRIEVIKEIFGEEFANGNDNERGVMFVW